MLDVHTRDHDAMLISIDVALVFSFGRYPQRTLIQRQCLRRVIAAIKENPNGTLQQLNSHDGIRFLLELLVDLRHGDNLHDVQVWGCVLSCVLLCWSCLITHGALVVFVFFSDAFGGFTFFIFFPIVWLLFRRVAPSGWAKLLALELLNWAISMSPTPDIRTLFYADSLTRSSKTCLGCLVTFLKTAKPSEPAILALVAAIVHAWLGTFGVTLRLQTECRPPSQQRGLLCTHVLLTLLLSACVCVLHVSCGCVFLQRTCQLL